MTVALVVTGLTSTPAAAAHVPAPATDVTIGAHPTAGALTGNNLGFSVESADLAHGYLTRQLLADRFRTLGHDGVLRLGGYSMDLVWPAFGAYRDSAPPPEAIGGIVDQRDFDGVRQLLDATGWKVTLGVPLKKIIDPAKIKDPTKDPSPAVTLDQVLAEVRAARQTFGSRLLAVEIGNEYDNVTTLTPAEYYEVLKDYAAAINRVAPGLRVTGPSANTAVTNTQLDGFVSALQADQAVDPRRLLSEITNHLYPTSHCGTSTTTIAKLLSVDTYTSVQQKLDGIRQIVGRLNDGMPAVLNETNTASCSGMPGVSDSYASALWALDYTMQATRAGIARLQFHTNTAAVCGDFKPRNSPDYPISYRYYGAFCAPDQTALAAQRLQAAPLYYGLWAASEVPVGRFVDASVPAEELAWLRAYAVRDARGHTSVVLIDLHDPAAQTSTDRVRLHLPRGACSARATVLRSTDPRGLASTDAAAITLGGRSVTDGRPTGRSASTRLTGRDGTLLVDLAPGTAQIVTIDR